MEKKERQRFGGKTVRKNITLPEEMEPRLEKLKETDDAFVLSKFVREKLDAKLTAEGY